MVNYELGKIYKLVCNETGMTYFGSTAQSTLAKRMGQHKEHYKMYKKGTRKTSNCRSFKILENGNYEMILVEDYPCERKEQLIARERWYIENNECVNKEIPGRTMKEWYKDNKEKVLEKAKEYYNENKEKVLERMNEKIRCECCDCEVSRANWSKHIKTEKHQADSK